MIIHAYRKELLGAKLSGRIASKRATGVAVGKLRPAVRKCPHEIQSGPKVSLILLILLLY
jgi:hypothetical protein